MVAYSIIRVTNDPWRRMASSSLARIAVALCLLLALASFPSKASVSELERARYEAAVAHCRSKPNQLSLNDDRSIFCFDGDVTRERDASSLESLNSGGLFVVRSSGGSGEVAARIATLLEGKEVTVVIHDYCLSACASYFFIASARTYVLKDSIVAWHHSKWRGWTPCEEYGLKYLSWDNVLHATEELCYKHSEPYLRRFGEILSVALPFFKRRIVDLEQFNFPTSRRASTSQRFWS